MKWMRERDLLIAQTLAFVQSVTGKAPEAERTTTASAALTVETLEATVVAVPLRFAPLPDVTPLPAQEIPAPPAAVQASPEPAREIAQPTPLPRVDLRSDFQSEIKARVANFRAQQERFSREREAYCAATMARVQASLREDNPPTRSGK
ncbi:hypothetical protein [Bradyrhizobium sp.]|jgi:hypothetical protein|uniref:hypothetical protein n=1 Tax=Bradyrhizobium sp. TaxID=376 RepID=UPI002C629592|nr:hypothetical protein [Bradyrhizobium sp.]HMM92279.1 hypothetical protein [Bradyrhizobium sp.]